jgi:hypothetical protein
MYDALEEISRSMMEQGHWSEGWIAARQTLYYDHEALSPEVMVRLRTLEAFLPPRDLVEKVRSVVLREGGSIVDFDGFDLDSGKAEGERGGYQHRNRLPGHLGRLRRVMTPRFASCCQNC